MGSECTNPARPHVWGVMDPLPSRRLLVEQAYREHAPEVYRVARAIVGNADLALDITQDAFARAFERWDRYDPGRPLRPWLLAITAHLALDRLRRARVRPTEVQLEDELPGGAGTGGDPASGVVRRVAIEAGLASLAPTARAAIVLRHYHGYDYEEIARILDVRLGTVGPLLSRAHAALRARLGPAAGDESSGQAAIGPATRPGATR